MLALLEPGRDSTRGLGTGRLQVTWFPSSCTTAVDVRESDSRYPMIAPAAGAARAATACGPPSLIANRPIPAAVPITPPTSVGPNDPPAAPSNPLPMP